MADSATQEPDETACTAGPAAWRGTMHGAQEALAAQLDVALATSFEATRYRRWLAVERGLVDDQLRRLLPIHAACAAPLGLAPWLDDHLQALRACRAALDADLGGDAEAPARLWPGSAVVHRHQVFGGIALLDAVMGGPVQAACAAVLAKAPAGCGHYLALRREQLALQMPWRRRALAHMPFDAPAWAAVVHGAGHAARVHAAASAAALG